VDTSKPYFAGFTVTPVSGAYQIYNSTAKTYTLTNGINNEGGLVTWPMPANADTKTLTVSWAMRTIAPSGAGGGSFNLLSGTSNVSVTGPQVGDFMALSLFKHLDVTNLHLIDYFGSMRVEINELRSQTILSVNNDPNKTFAESGPLFWVGGEYYFIFTKDPGNRCSLYMQMVPATNGPDKSAVILVSTTIPAFTPNSPSENYFLVFEGYSGSDASATRVIRDIQVTVT
jgi:hypothetical protein